MKKLSLLLALILVMALIFTVFTACSKDENKDNTKDAAAGDSDNGENETPAEPTVPVIDGVIDAIWDKAEAYHLSKVKVGADTGVDSYFKILYDENKLYVLVVVPDKTPNYDHNDNYQKDGIETPIDFRNIKSAKYEDDGQINLTFFRNGNDFIFGQDGKGAWTADMIEWALKDNGADGYIVEIAYNVNAAIGMKLAAGTTIGIDMQVNDNAEGTGRTACYAWSDEIDKVWENPSVMGEITLK